MPTRQLFDFTDTGYQAISGPNSHGRVAQYRWVNVSGDTGGTLEISINPRQADTGDGWLLVTRGLEPQARGSFNAGDTGIASHVAGDRVRAVKSGATGTGRLYVWLED